jgi:hypothetical protein
LLLYQSLEDIVMLIYTISSMRAVRNIPLVLAATEVQDPISGKTFILVFNEVPWYRYQKDHSLINPKHLRYFSITMYDNQIDAFHPMIIQKHYEAMSIPFKLKVATVYIESHTPTSQESDNSTDDKVHASLFFIGVV